MRKIAFLPSRAWFFLAIPFLVCVPSSIILWQQASKAPKRTEVIDVGMVALLANANKYDGKRVRTIGFVSLETEGQAVYLHREDFVRGLINNSLTLMLSNAQLREMGNRNLKYVVLEGTVYANGPENDIRSGAIGDITRFEIWPPGNSTDTSQ